MSIHKGSTRVCVCVGKVAIKFPRMYSWRSFLNGLLANMTEREFDCIAPALHAKVHYADRFGILLIMERADYVLPYVVNDFVRPSLDSFIKECESKGLPVEHKYNNIGSFDGALKVIDFGS